MSFHVYMYYLKYLLHPLQLLFESGINFIRHVWKCGYCSREATKQKQHLIERKWYAHLRKSYCRRILLCTLVNHVADINNHRLTLIHTGHQHYTQEHFRLVLKGALSTFSKVLKDISTTVHATTTSLVLVCLAKMINLLIWYVLVFVRLLSFLIHM